MNVRLLFPIFFPILAGLFLLLKREFGQRKHLIFYTGAVLIVTFGLVIPAITGKGSSYTLLHLTKDLPIYFKIDELGRVFAVLMSILWLLAGFFSFEYMKKEEREKRYYGFFLVVNGVLTGLYFSGNLITMYLFYEIMTLLSMPLVLHSQTKEAIMAGLKYLFYSIFGAYMALFGIYVICGLGEGMEFTPGGVLSSSILMENQSLMLVVTMFLILGFGVKAGMFPLHGWLPTAHPVAPGPASAVFSGIIVKSGVLAMIRVIYYLIGPEFLRGSWVQTVFLTLALITVFMGSMLAYREKNLKKRLAYSTVSQISYILFGIGVLEQTAFSGALLHVVAHVFIKGALFLCAAAFIYRTGKKRVDELTGIGKEMPVTLWCYTIASLGLIGIPPTSGFMSKWYLAEGALQSDIPVFSWLGPVILLLSALLTAGYLLPITMKGFFPGIDSDESVHKKKEVSGYMLLPLIVLSVLTVGIGLMPNLLTHLFTVIAGQVL